MFSSDSPPSYDDGLVVVDDDVVVSFSLVSVAVIFSLFSLCSFVPCLLLLVLILFALDYGLDFCNPLR